MSADDRATGFEKNRFQERKQELYRCLNEDKSEYLKHSKLKRKDSYLNDDVLKDFFFSLLNPVVDQLELHTAHYSYGNGEVIIDHLFKNSDNIIKKAFITLKEVKNVVLYFLCIDLSSCRFVVDENDCVKLIVWFECVGEGEVFNYFSGTQEFEKDECGYFIDSFDEYEVAVNGQSVRFSIYDKNFFGSTRTVDTSKTDYKRDKKTGLSRRSRIFNKSVKKMERSRELISHDWWKKLDKLKYKIPQEYIQWKELTNVFKSSIGYGAMAMIEKDVNHFGLIEVAKGTKAWVDTNSPLFLVTSELIEIFKDLKPPTIQCLLTATESLYPNIVLIFPSECQYLWGDSTGFFDYCIITRRIEYEAINEYSKEYIRRKEPLINISGIATEITPFCYGLSEYIFGTENIDMMSSTSHPVGSTLIRIVAQCLLLIASKPELVITSDQIKSFNYETSGQGFQRPKNGEKVLYPRVLNLSYAEKKIRSDDTRSRGTGNGSPKSPHWRLGYEVNKPVGKMKGVPKEQWERKRIKVAPYFVLGGDHKDFQETS